MGTIQPQGESLRNAVKWISEERKQNPDQNNYKLVEKACVKFNLSPKDEAYLLKALKDYKET
jgi:hypothetical protein